jgi:Pyruvate/2-oxoacid:ferredoxin oxidoreductase delta subunit
MEVTDECIACVKCVPYCPEAAITIKKVAKDKMIAVIDANKCVECDVCYRSMVCPVDALKPSELQWPRSLRRVFSGVLKRHDTGIPGRGTAEMKTNDVTGRYGRGEVGISIDVGRPSIGTTFEDIETIAKAVAKLDVKFEDDNPVTALMKNKKTGEIRDDVKKERVHSGIIEFKVHTKKFLTVMEILQQVSKEVNTVFSVGVVCRAEQDGSLPLKKIMDDNKIFYRCNGKVNLGLGRPLAGE